MRIKITFACKDGPTSIPINTNYYIVTLINFLCHEYKKYLKALVSLKQNVSNFDIYTFSQLIIPLRKIEKFKINILSEGFFLYISSPYYQFLSILSQELLKRKKAKIFDQWFDINDVDFIASPEFNDTETQFTCLSPVTVYKSEQKKNKDKQYQKYLFPNEDDYTQCLEKDLLQKYNLINNEQRSHLDLNIQFDTNYMKRKKNKITKVITLENKSPNPAQIRGVLAPFKIQADPDVLRVIYDAGLGRLNNLGFGMVETVSNVRSAQ